MELEPDGRPATCRRRSCSEEECPGIAIAGAVPTAPRPQVCRDGPREAAHRGRTFRWQKAYSVRPPGPVGAYDLLE